MFKKTFSKGEFKAACERFFPLNLKNVVIFLLLWFLLGLFGRSMFKYHCVMTSGKNTWLETDEKWVNLAILTGPVGYLSRIVGIALQDNPQWGIIFSFKAQKILTIEEARKLK